MPERPETAGIIDFGDAGYIRESTNKPVPNLEWWQIVTDDGKILLLFWKFGVAKTPLQAGVASCMETMSLDQLISSSAQCGIEQDIINNSTCSSDMACSHDKQMCIPP